jgi:hypothetical protein
VVKTNSPISGATFHAWTTPADFAAGTSDHVVPTSSGGVTLAEADKGSWTSPWHEPDEHFTKHTTSWQADTPEASWIAAELQLRTATTESPWYDLCEWAFDTVSIKRATAPDHTDEFGAVATDSFDAADDPPGGLMTGYRIRVTLHRGDREAPVVRQVAAATTRRGTVPETSTPLAGERELPVPRLSQSIHRDEFPEFGGGGQVWCSPTSVSMVMAHWGVMPDPDELAALPADEVFDRNGRKDPVVPWSTARTWDYTYNGAGGWSFNTAYASAFGLDGSVRYGTSLRDIETWIHRGVPVVVSINWNNKDGDESTDMIGSWITDTGGHLMVVVGFTADGDVIANDPASPSNEEVRRIYRRHQFERNWLRASTGAMYIIKDGSVPG